MPSKYEGGDECKQLKFQERWENAALHRFLLHARYMKGSQSEPPQTISLWHKDYFELQTWVREDIKTLS